MAWLGIDLADADSIVGVLASGVALGVALGILAAALALVAGVARDA